MKTRNASQNKEPVHEARKSQEWIKPLLETKKIKDITRSGNGSGNDGGTVAGMMMV